MTERYRLPSGRETHHRNISSHHLNWRRKDYTHQIDKRYRSNLILPLDNSVHSELHKELYPPPKPSRELMNIVLNHQTEADTPYERFVEIAVFLGNIAQTSWNAERADEAGRIYENYLEQDEFIKQGLATPLWIENQAQ